MRSLNIFFIAIGTFISIAQTCQANEDLIDKPFYRGIWMGIRYDSFIMEKHLLKEKHSWKYKFRIRYVDPDSKRVSISKWHVADCNRSTINGELVPALKRYGYERGHPELIRAICMNEFRLDP